MVSLSPVSSSLMNGWCSWSCAGGGRGQVWAAWAGGWAASQLPVPSARSGGSARTTAAAPAAPAAPAARAAPAAPAGPAGPSRPSSPSSSPTCSTTNLRLHLWQIFRKVSHAMSCGSRGEGGRSALSAPPAGRRAGSCAPVAPQPSTPPASPAAACGRLQSPAVACAPARAPHLHARVRLVHELEQLVDHRLEELPVRAQELGVLAHHVPGGEVGGGGRVGVDGEGTRSWCRRAGSWHPRTGSGPASVSISTRSPSPLAPAADNSQPQAPASPSPQRT
jgi:hypothetical protein